ncbi:E3 ubiquitin-protein ligase CHIP-like isoform X2 [Sipha flava]|nr:E3 ubiquitin-protein ligase CHIP-like isoform X2 [Sipha flava]
MYEPIKSDYVTINQSDIDLKVEGNRLFNAKRYSKAIECYSMAIVKNHIVPEYFTNRALCFLRLNKWNEAYSDCCQALELDSEHIKGCFFLGKTLIELGKYDEALQKLQKAHNLAKEKKINYGDDITRNLRKARRLKWEKQESLRQSQEMELLSYLKKLMEDDMIRKINDIKLPSEDKDQIEEFENRTMEIQNQNEKNISELHTIFVKNDDRLKKRELPDFLCGNISCNIVKDPVVTPSGISYDRKDVEEHLMKIGHFDPVSGRPLTVEQLIPNLALKEAAETFAMENDWLDQYCI